MTSRAAPIAIVRRSIEVGNVAELSARESRGLGLLDALDLTALITPRDGKRSRQIAAGWLQCLARRDARRDDRRRGVLRRLPCARRAGGTTKRGVLGELVA